MESCELLIACGRKLTASKLHDCIVRNVQGHEARSRVTFAIDLNVYVTFKVSY